MGLGASPIGGMLGKRKIVPFRAHSLHNTASMQNFDRNIKYLQKDPADLKVSRKGAGVQVPSPAPSR
jgi:hypothetical protein